MKKFISVMVALLMLLSVCIPAFAYTDQELIEKYNLSEKSVQFMKEHGVDIQIFENAPQVAGFPDRYNTSIEGLIMEADAYGFSDKQINDYIAGLIKTQPVIIGGPYDNTGRKTVYPLNCPFYIHGERINHEDTLYPLITFKGEVFVPMTYEYARMLKLSTTWENTTIEKEGCFSIYKDSNANAHYVEYEKADNSRKGMYAYWTNVLTYGVKVNGELINSDDVLNFRNVTYFPLNDKYMKNAFGLDYTYDDNGVSLIINQ